VHPHPSGGEGICGGVTPLVIASERTSRAWQSPRNVTCPIPFVCHAELVLASSFKCRCERAYFASEAISPDVSFTLKAPHGYIQLQGDCHVAPAGLLAMTKKYSFQKIFEFEYRIGAC
jgi:hypothetical protein